ncbi:hypothetical protein [Nocardia beijingensis]|uniref:hypothetical protein n=1 Tax=Nocardia beijingensis TaxID=95162 RepID=UPI0012F488EB|nr:hypothetical protein [Nocardia beijingensis]
MSDGTSGEEFAEVEPVTGKVARVLNSRRLVINRGSEHGVELEDRFKVMAPEGEPILDPDTGLTIGSVPFEKVRVRIIEVYDHMSVGITYRKVTVGGTNPLSDMFGPRREEFEEIRSPAEERVEGDRLVRIGDPVVQVLQG